LNKLILITVWAVLSVCSGCGPVQEQESFGRSLLRVEDELSEEELNSRIESLELKLSDDPDNWRLRHFLAIYYKRLGTPYSRAKAIREIDKAIALNPSEPELYMERGRINQNRNFIGEAEASFSKALEIDPDNYEAICQLATIKKNRYLRSMCFPEYAAEAADLYADAAEIDPAGPEAISELITLNILLERPDTALNYAREMTSLMGDSPLPHILLGIIHLKKKNLKEAEREFSKSLEIMEPAQKEVYMDIYELLEEEQKERFAALPENWKKKYIRNFWIERDPTPATDLNERRLEHYRRVYMARYLFRNEDLGFAGPETDRGRSLIKYGMPDRIIIPFDQRGVESWDASIIAWNYYRESPAFTLYFMDEFLNGNYHIPIDRRLGKYCYTNLFVESVIPESYRYPIEFSSLEVYSQAVQKRASAEETALFYSVSIPTDQIFQQDSPCRILFSIRDSNNNRIYRADFPFCRDSLRIIHKWDRGYFLLRHAVSLRPRTGESIYHVTCIDSSGRKRGTAAGQFRFIDYSTGRLTISDIAISLSGTDRQCDPWPDGRSVFPLGSYLCLSYDIYNLRLNSGGESRYRLTYTIIPYQRDSYQKGAFSSILDKLRKIAGSGSRSFISNSVSLNSYSDTVSDRLVIETGSLQQDRYLIRLEVRDLESGHTASRERVFVLRED